MDSSESPFTNLDVWCEWCGDPTETVHVALTVEVWCTPGSEITMLDTSHSSVTKIVDYALTPVGNFENLDDVHLLHLDTETNMCSCVSSMPEQQAQVPVTPEKQRVPAMPEKNTPHITLHPGHPNGLIDMLTPSDSGSVLRNSHTPDGSPAKTLEAFMTSFYQISSPSESVSEVGQSPSIPRKRNAKAASLPDSVTDEERTYGGEKLDRKSRALLKRKESLAASTEVSSTSSPAEVSRARCLIPRPVSAMSQARPNPTKVPLPTDSVPVLEAELCRFENSVSPVEKTHPVDHVQVEHKIVAEAVSGDTMTPLASPSTKTSLDVSNGDAGKPLQNGLDMENLSTVASAGSPCNMTLMSESVDASFGGIPAPGIFLVAPPTPPRTFNRPRLVLIDQVFQIQCPSDIEPVWYKATVNFVLRLQPGRPRGWYDLVVPGLPHLNANEPGYVYIRVPDGQGFEFRTMQFKRHEIVEGCLIAQFPVIKSKLVIPVRPCDFRFYGFLRDFMVNQTIRSKVITDKLDSTSCIVDYTAVCSLDLIQRSFSAEQCGFYLYIHGGPAGEYKCHLETPKTRFQTIQLGSDPESEVGITQLQVICTRSNLRMFVVKWEMRQPRAEASSWMPRITALPEGNFIEEELQARYLDAAEDQQEIVHCEAKSRIVVTLEKPTVEKSFMPLVMKMFIWFMMLLLLLQPVVFSIGLYDGVLRDGLGQEVGEIFCQKSKLCVLNSSLKQLGMSYLGVVPHVPEPPGAVETVVPIVPEEIDLQPPEPIPPWAPTTFRDHVDYFLGWRGPLPIGGRGRYVVKRECAFS